MPGLLEDNGKGRELKEDTKLVGLRQEDERLGWCQRTAMTVARKNNKLIGSKKLDSLLP